MVLSQSELERLADDTYRGRIITGSVFCNECGYNLRTLPYVYTCPECGNQYNARPLVMKGIFQPYAAEIPWGDMFAAVFCVGGAVTALVDATNPINCTRVAVAAALIFLAFLFASRASGGFRRLAKARGIARRIASEENE